MINAPSDLSVAAVRDTSRPDPASTVFESHGGIKDEVAEVIRAEPEVARLDALFEHRHDAKAASVKFVQLCVDVGTGTGHCLLRAVDVSLDTSRVSAEPKVGYLMGR